MQIFGEWCWRKLMNVRRVNFWEGKQTGRNEKKVSYLDLFWQ